MTLRTGTIGTRSALAFFALLCHLLLPAAHAQLMASQSDGPLSALICGAGSDAFDLTVTKNILDLDREDQPLEAMLADTTEVDYATYAKYRGKLVMSGGGH